MYTCSHLLYLLDVFQVMPLCVSYRENIALQTKGDAAFRCVAASVTDLQLERTCVGPYRPNCF